MSTDHCVVIVAVRSGAAVRRIDDVWRHRIMNRADVHMLMTYLTSRQEELSAKDRLEEAATPGLRRATRFRGTRRLSRRRRPCTGFHGLGAVAMRGARYAPHSGPLPRRLVVLGLRDPSHVLNRHREV